MAAVKHGHPMVGHLTAAVFDALDLLHITGTAFTVDGFANRTGMSHDTAAKRLYLLHKAGLVDRHRDDPGNPFANRDGAYLHTLSEYGRNELQKAADGMAEAADFTCKTCTENRTHHARGYCHRCYQAHVRRAIARAEAS